MPEILEIIGTTGIWILIFWVPYQIRRLNQTIDAQSKLIASFESQSNYVGNIQETMSRLYDPKEIESIVSAKVESEVNSHKKEQNENIQKSFNMFIAMYSKDIATLARLTTMLSWHVSARELKDATKEFIDAGGNSEIADLIKVSQDKYQKEYQDAMLRALGGSLDE